MNVTAPENRQEQQQDTGINELKTVEAILQKPEDAENLKNKFGAKLEKELTTGQQGLNHIKNLKKSLSEINTNDSKLGDNENAGLQALDRFLNDCLQKNDMVQTHNKNIIQMLNKLDNGMGRNVNIDEKNISMKSVSLDGDNINLEYKLDEKNMIKFSLGGNGIRVDDGDITIPDKEGKDQYFNIVQDDKGGLKLETNPDGLRAKLASYNVTGDAKEGAIVTKESTGYRVEMKNKIDDSLISFVLDNNGEIPAKERMSGDYKISIQNNTFNIIDQKAAEKREVKKAKENQEIGQLDFNGIVDKKIQNLQTQQNSETAKNTEEGFKKAGEIQTQIKSLEEMKTNYGKISEKITEIDGKISDKTKEIDKARTDKDFNNAAKLAGERTALESQKSEIQNLELEMKKGAQEDKWEDVTKTWEKINALINPQAASASAGAGRSVEDSSEGTENPAEITKESVINKILNPKLKEWYTKEGSRNQLEGTISLLKIGDLDTPDIKAKKTELSALLADGDIVEFQEALGLKKGVNFDQADGKLGEFTLNKTKEILKSKTAQVDATSTNQISTETNAGTSTETNAGTSTETSTGTSTETSTGTSTETSTGTSTETSTGTSTETNAGTNTETSTGTSTETSTGTSTEATESDLNIYRDINSLRANLNPDFTNPLKVQDYLNNLNNLYNQNLNTQEKGIIKKEYIRTKFENVFTNNSSIRNGKEQRGLLNNGSYTARYDKESDILTLTISDNEKLVYTKKEFLGN